MNKEVQRVKINQSIVNTYSYLKANFSEDDFLVSLENNSQVDCDFSENVSLNYDKSFSYEELKSIFGKINNVYDEKIVEDLFKGKQYNVNFKENSEFNFKNDLNNSSSNCIVNIQGDGDTSNLIFYSEIFGHGEQFNHFYNIDLKNDSKVKLVIFTNSDAKGFINVLGNCNQSSNIEILFVNVNKNNVYTDCKVILNGEKSSSNIDVCYICSGDSKFDYNLVSSMYGKESNAKINGKGILLDNSKKIFRGTIDFKKGCINAKGSENEEVIILSKNVKNQSLPLLLCDEKNVQGSHGFTANSINQDKVFYLLSRGFNENEAKGLILKGKFLSLFKNIDRQEIIDRFINILMEAI